jgi:hypothetical protein
MKLDDDVWVNINALLTATKSSSFIKYIGCYCYNGAVPVREMRHKQLVDKTGKPTEKMKSILLLNFHSCQ